MRARDETRDTVDDFLALPVLVERRAAEHPARLFLQEAEGEGMTYADADADARRWAAAYRALGVGPGDHVLTLLPTGVASVSSWLGLGWLRAVEVTAHTEYRGAMLDYVVGDSGARLAIVAHRYLDHLVGVEAVAGLEAVVVADADGPFAPLACPVLGGEAFFAGADGDAPLDTTAPPGPWDIACIIYTSGTTGPSKGVVVPWGQLHASSPLEWSSGAAEECQYVPYPMYHVAGKAPVYLMARLGGCAVLRAGFRGPDFWDDIRRHRCTVTILAGTMPGFLLHQEARADDADNPLRVAIMAPVIPEFGRFAERFDVEIRTGFNMTEISLPLLFADGIPDHQSCGAVRQGYPGYEVRVVDAHDLEVPPHTAGELVVRTAVPWTLNAGYWGKAEATAAAWRNGWFHTGDAFTYDEARHYFFVDRMKDTIRRRGENISSFEVEAIVAGHPAVAECAAVAVPAELGEDEVLVVVVPRPGQRVEPAELVEFLAPQMPRFMVPRYVIVAAELPKTDATLRVRKHELRQLGVTAATWDREAAGLELPR